METGTAQHMVILRTLLVTFFVLFAGCATLPVHPDVRITQENARLIEQRDGLIEHMDMLQIELYRLRMREEYLTQELLRVDARRLF